VARQDKMQFSRNQQIASKCHQIGKFDRGPKQGQMVKTEAEESEEPVNGS
jgi:hypothetical protein